MLRNRTGFLFLLILTLLFISGQFGDKVFGANQIEGKSLQSNIIGADTVAVSYKKHIQPIWDRYGCAICHSPSSNFAYPDLRKDHSYRALQKYGYINTKEPEKSLLVSPWLTDGLMPPDFQRLTNDEIDLILKWIRQGALDS